MCCLLHAGEAGLDHPEGPGTAKDVSWSRSGDISEPCDRVRRELESALKAALRKGVKSAFKGVILKKQRAPPRDGHPLSRRQRLRASFGASQRDLAAGLSPPPRTHRRLWKRRGCRVSLRSEASLALGVAPDVAAHDIFGFLPSDAACGTRTRCGRSSWPPLSPPSRHPLRPIA